MNTGGTLPFYYCHPAASHFGIVAHIVVELSHQFNVCSVTNFSLTLSADCRDQTKFYGETFKMLRFSGAKTWEFLPLNKKSPIVLWRDDGTIKDSRRKSSGIYFTVYNVTQLDRGQYSLKDRNIVLSSSYLDVVGELKV